jgi:hypothetical protein
MPVILTVREGKQMEINVWNGQEANISIGQPSYKFSQWDKCEMTVKVKTKIPESR